MKKNFFMLKMIGIGAVSGALISLLDPEVRKDCKETIRSCKKQVTYSIEHPAEMMGYCREGLDVVTNVTKDTLDMTIYAMDKLEDVIDNIDIK
ncbi:hypothetical protein DES38_11150 [Streptohalobacillus salinus]|uniref:Gas vesicle protein n=1 Tax=Streptohalobacillus salinus TaxID=621096 RepID=A0A2V3W760_9BACI|nr:hypothetical protein [Streptohalobacillus salinus]PXW89004.1 hypothetical protein DES38_11150 [Streptohalobacillus salinus]